MYNNKRNISLDVLRIFACFMIVLMHSPMPTAISQNGVLQSCISLFTAPGIGIFFMISGYLLLPVSESSKSFIKRRLGKLTWATVLWSLIYMALNWINTGIAPSIANIFSIPFSVQGCGILWFMYAIIGLYLVAPIISPWLMKADWDETKIYMSIIVLAFCFPILSLCLMVNVSESNTFYYFLGYVGYFFMGWAFKQFGPKFKLSWLFIGYLTVWISAIMCKCFDLRIDFYSLYWYQSITALITAAFWFKLFTVRGDIYHKLPIGVARCITKVSNLTLGVYLIHFAIIRYVIWHWTFIIEIQSYLIQSLVIAILGFVMSLAFSYLIALSPVGKYLIGYRLKTSTNMYHRQ